MKKGTVLFEENLFIDLISDCAVGDYIEIKNCYAVSIGIYKIVEFENSIAFLVNKKGEKTHRTIKTLCKKISF